MAGVDVTDHPDGGLTKSRCSTLHDDHEGNKGNSTTLIIILIPKKPYATRNNNVQSCFHDSVKP